MSTNRPPFSENSSQRSEATTHDQLGACVTLVNHPVEQRRNVVIVHEKVYQRVMSQQIDLNKVCTSKENSSDFQ